MNCLPRPRRLWRVASWSSPESAKRKAGCKPGTRGIEVVPASTNRTRLGAGPILRYQSGWPCGSRGPAGDVTHALPSPLGTCPGALRRATAGRVQIRRNKVQTAAAGCRRCTAKLKSPKPARRYSSWRVCLTELSQWKPEDPPGGHLNRLLRSHLEDRQGRGTASSRGLQGQCHAHARA